jgi:peptidoglycan DL-endopeptidase CwlO
MRRRRRLSRNQKLIGSAVAAGLLLAAGHGQGGPGHVTAASAASGSSNEQLANSMAASGYRWAGTQTTCLDELWTEESGFSATAYNSSSGATGIPQLLPGAHAIPANWSDPRVQIRWGLAYIHDRYGSPCAAWTFERSHTPNWY